jgi:hypothetical protein
VHIFSIYRGLQNLHSWVRIPPAPPDFSRCNASLPSANPATARVDYRQRFELGVILAVLLGASAVLFWGFLPLPHQDLNYYTEPAYLLATTGRLAGPGSQGVDLTFQKGIYSYPPGYFLILAAWLRTFGLSPDSLLVYTHLAHVGVLTMTWILMRFRYHCSTMVSALVVLASFPSFTHGRPDQTAAAFGIAAWLALPEKIDWPRMVLSGALAGCSAVISPAFGVATVSTLMILQFVDESRPLAARMRGAIVWLTSLGLVFGAVVASVLTWQHSWRLAYVQFRTNATIRGSELNVWPNFRLPFTWEFSVIPFLLIALLPALLTVSLWRKEVSSGLRRMALAFLGSSALWLAMNKSQLLTGYHFTFPTKNIFVAMFYSWPKFPRWVRLIPLSVLCAISIYYYKSDFLYLGSPLRAEQQISLAQVKTRGVVAVDSLYFASLYRTGETLNYEVSITGNYWPRYLAAIPENQRKEILEGITEKPTDAGAFVFSAFTISRMHLNPPADTVCEKPAAFGERLHVLGRSWNLPAEPFAMAVCIRK